MLKKSPAMRFGLNAGWYRCKDRGALHLLCRLSLSGSLPVSSHVSGGNLVNDETSQNMAAKAAEAAAPCAALFSIKSWRSLSRVN